MIYSFKIVDDRKVGSELSYFNESVTIKNQGKYKLLSVGSNKPIINLSFVTEPAVYGDGEKMYHRGNDRSETRRREDYEDGDYRNSTSNKPRSRWDDDRDRAPRRDEEERRKDTSGVSRSRWDSGRGEDVGSVGSSNRWEENRYSNTSHSRLDDRRSRSRSKSPFRRKDDEYSRYSNPSRHGNKESLNHSSGTGNNSYGKSSSWSDSSDEEGCKNRSRSNPSDVSMKASQGNTAAASSADDKGNNPNSSSAGLCLKLSGPGSSSKSAMPLPKILSVSAPIKSTKVASIFNIDDDDDEPEEMPAECKMRMKNVGRETKTSEGPNSFGKTKIGFCNLSHLAEKRLEGKGGGKKKP